MGAEGERVRPRGPGYLEHGKENEREIKRTWIAGTREERERE